MPTLDELAERLRHVEETLWPAGPDGLPLPTSRDDKRVYSRTAIDGPRWQIGDNWTVIAGVEPEETESWVYLRDPYGQATGDIESLTPATALQLAASLVAAARWQTDALARRRSNQETT